MGGVTKMLGMQPKAAAGPSAAQLQAQQAQAEAIAAEEARLAREEEAQAASRRARLGRNAGRALLLDDDELGVTGADGRPLSTRLGA